MPVTNSALDSPAIGIDTPIEADSPSKVNSPSNESQTTQSVTDSVYVFPKENGRTYHGYRAGTYNFPNDHNETDRLDFQYEILKYCFRDKNYFAPLSDPKEILDIGTGTGQWAIEMGDEFPDASVQATDLSPIQPNSVPENVQFFIDDAAEEDWALPPAYFDYIHTRVLLGCFEDFRDIIKRAFYYTKPGGYMESQEIMSTLYCDDGTMPSDWPFLEWNRYLDDAAMSADRPMRIANKMKRWYEQAGFVDVQEKVFKLPVNPWPRDPHLKTLGKMQEANWLAGLNAISMGLFSRVFGWNKTEIEVYLVNVRKSISNKRVHAYNRVFVVWGRKPTDEEILAKQAQAEERPSTAVSGPSHTAPTSFATEDNENPSNHITGNELSTKEVTSRPGTAVPGPAPMPTNSRPGTAKGKDIEGSIEMAAGEELLPKEDEVGAMPDSTTTTSADSAREGSSELVFSSMSLNDPSPKDESPGEEKI